MQKDPIHQSHIYRQIKILRTIFEKGHSRNIPVKLFQNLTSSFEEEYLFRISSCPYSARNPIHQSHVYGRIKISRPLFEKGHPRNIHVKLFQNLTGSFGEEDFLGISSCPYSARNPIHKSHVYGRIKISRTIFEKGHPRHTPVKLFQISKSDQQFRRRRFFLEFLHVPIVREAPIHQSHVYGRIKISRPLFEKGHPRNIHVKLFQNLTGSFGEEDFLGISSCPYSARSPHSPEPCFWADQNFAKIFEKGHLRNIPMKLFQNRTSGFRGEDF